MQGAAMPGGEGREEEAAVNDKMAEHAAEKMAEHAGEDVKNQRKAFFAFKPEVLKLKSGEKNPEIEAYKARKSSKRGRAGGGTAPGGAKKKRAVEAAAGGGGHA